MLNTPPLPRVLIVEDDDAIRTMLLAAFAREPVSAVGARDGLEAVAMLRAAPYAVVIIDLMMPRMNGFELLDELALDPPQPRPVIFVMTAYDDAVLRKLDPDLVHGVLRKPFDVERLVEMAVDCALLFRDMDRRYASAASDPARLTPGC